MLFFLSLNIIRYSQLPHLCRSQGLSYEYQDLTWGPNEFPPSHSNLNNHISTFLKEKSVGSCCFFFNGEEGGGQKALPGKVSAQEFEDFVCLLPEAKKMASELCIQQY